MVKKRKKSSKKKTAAKRKTATVRRNPSPAPKRRRRAAKMPIQFAKASRRRRVKKNPKLDIMDIAKAALAGLAVPVIGQIAALRYAAGDVDKQLMAQRLGGAAAAGLGAYLMNEGENDLGIAMIAGGASLALANELTVMGAARLGAALTTSTPAATRSRTLRGYDMPALEGIHVGTALEGIHVGTALEGVEDDGMSGFDDDY